MKKADIITKLEGHGIEVPKGATVAQLEELADKEGVNLGPGADPRAAVKVRALKHLAEGGIHHAPGEVFEVNADRVPALGKLIEPA